LGVFFDAKNSKKSVKLSNIL
jgi:hypothetical protein